MSVALDVETTVDRLVHIVALIERLVDDVSGLEVSWNHFETARVLLQSASSKPEQSDQPAFLDRNHIENILENVIGSARPDVQEAFFIQLNESITQTLANAWILSNSHKIFAILLNLLKSKHRQPIVNSLSQIISLNFTESHFTELVGSENDDFVQDKIEFINKAACADRVDDYFLFTGKSGAGIKIPPLKKLPPSFTIALWIMIDPPNGHLFDKRKPIVYRLRSKNVVDFTCRIIGNCFSLFYRFQKTKKLSKSMNFCIQKELETRTWYLLTITHSTNSWTNQTSINCFLNDQNVGQCTMDASISKISEDIDQNSIGCSLDCKSQNDSLLGAISSFYMFSLAIDEQLIACLHRLGPNYKGLFAFVDDSQCGRLSGLEKKILIESNLSRLLIVSYRSSYIEDSLIAQQQQQLPAEHFSSSFFVYGQSAQLTQIGLGCFRVSPSTIYDCFHSNAHAIDGFFEFHRRVMREKWPDLSGKLIEASCALLANSDEFAIQFDQSKGFQLIAALIIRVLDDNQKQIALTRFINLLHKPKPIVFSVLKTLVFNPMIVPNLKNSSLKRSTLKSIDYLDPIIFTNLEIDQRIQIVHLAINFFNRENANIDLDQELVQLLVSIIRRLTSTSSNSLIASHRILNSVLEFCESANSHDDDRALELFLQLTFDLICDLPKGIVPAFETSDAVRTFVWILNRKSSSPSSDVVLKVVRAIGMFLKRSTRPRKQQVLNTNHLLNLILNLIGERSLDDEDDQFKIDVVYTLFQMMTDSITADPADQFVFHKVSTSGFIENRELVVPIAKLIQSASFKSVRAQLSCDFVRFLLVLCKNVEENRRAILRIGIWQYALANFIDFAGDDDENDDVMELFVGLICQAIKFENEGWRVWIDTMSILHIIQSSGQSASIEQQSNQRSSPPAGQTFRFSRQHHQINISILRRLSAELSRIEDLSDYMSIPTNRTFSFNLLNVLNVIIEMILGSTTTTGGGLVNVLAEFVDNRDRDIAEKCESDEFPREILSTLIDLLCALIDVFLLSTQNTAIFSKMEKEHEKASGSVIRQFLRFYIFQTIWNSMRIRQQQQSTNSFSHAHYDNMNDPSDLLLIDLSDLLNDEDGSARIRMIEKRDGIVCGRDTCRFRNLIYRELDDSKQARSMILSTIYFFAILMVSEYEELIAVNNDDHEDRLNSIDRTFGFCGAFLSDILIEYSYLLDNALVSSHGQDLFKTGLQSLKQSNYSSLSLVMLFCSQEWQAALQKYGGSAFVELVNEGRLLDWEHRNHMVRVANEANLIAKMDQVEKKTKHKDFLDECERFSEERCRKFEINQDFLIRSAIDDLRKASAVDLDEETCGVEMRGKQEPTNNCYAPSNDDLAEQLNDGLVKYYGECWLIDFVKSIPTKIWIDESTITLDPSSKESGDRLLQIGLDKICMVLSRSEKEPNDSLELFLINQNSLLFRFSDNFQCKRVLGALPAIGLDERFGLAKTRESSFLSTNQIFSQSSMTNLWQHHRISNFDYLMFLNIIAGRSFRNSKNYPVFPWILSDYESEQIDLSSATIFRDLCRPMNMLIPNKLKKTQTIDLVHEYLSLDDSVPPRSFSFYFQQCQLNRANHELIPQFFHSPESCAKIGLPAWALNDPYTFTHLNRLALESDQSSCHLHHWIDFTFGYKLKCPLIQSPHPPRLSKFNKNPMEFEVRDTESCTVLSFPSSSTPVRFIDSLQSKTIVVLSAKLELSLNPYHSSSRDDKTQTTTNRLSQLFIGNTIVDRLVISPDPNLKNPAEYQRRLQLLTDGFPLLHYNNNQQRQTMNNQSIFGVFGSRYLVVAGYSDRSVRVFDLTNKDNNLGDPRLVQVLFGHHNLVTNLAVSNKTNRLVTGSNDGVVCIWRWNSNNDQQPNQVGFDSRPSQIIRCQLSETCGVSALALSSWSVFISYQSTTSSSIFHCSFNGRLISRFELDHSPKLAIVQHINSAGLLLVCNPSQSTLSLYSSTGKLVRRASVQPEIGIVQCMCLSEDEMFLCLAGDNGIVQILRSFYLTPIYSYPGFDAAIRAMYIVPSSGGKHICVGLANGKLALLNVNFNLFSPVVVESGIEEK